MAVDDHQLRQILRREGDASSESLRVLFGVLDLVQEELLELSGPSRSGEVVDGGLLGFHGEEWASIGVPWDQGETPFLYKYGSTYIHAHHLFCMHV